jgi:hypothetical protein
VVSICSRKQYISFAATNGIISVTIIVSIKISYLLLYKALCRLQCSRYLRLWLAAKMHKIIASPRLKEWKSDQPDTNCSLRCAKLHTSLTSRGLTDELLEQPYLSREHKQQPLNLELTWNTSWPWGTWRLLAHNVFHYVVVSRNTVV